MPLPEAWAPAGSGAALPRQWENRRSSISSVSVSATPRSFWKQAAARSVRSRVSSVMTTQCISAVYSGKQKACLPQNTGKDTVSSHDFYPTLFYVFATLNHHIISWSLLYFPYQHTILQDGSYFERRIFKWETVWERLPASDLQRAWMLSLLRSDIVKICHKEMQKVFWSE